MGGLGTTDWRGFGDSVGLVVRRHGLATTCDFSAVGPVVGCGVWVV